MEHGFEQPLAELSQRVYGPLWGKYRGLVESVDDPEGQGRIEVRVASVFGPRHKVFAFPGVPFAGPGYGMMFLPKKDDGVWIEFEDGDSSLPIWTGCWWARNEVPTDATADKRVVITPAGHKVVLDDAGRKIQLLHCTKGEITLAETSITIKFGPSSIVLDDTGVAINGTALKVTS
jgi:uncharacterized protein involved in type VI secretion and phage assembly